MRQLLAHEKMSTFTIVEMQGVTPTRSGSSSGKEDAVAFPLAAVTLFIQYPE